VNDTLESCVYLVSKALNNYSDASNSQLCHVNELKNWMGNVLMTENNLEAMAAPAMSERIVNRRSPLVFLPVLPLKKGSVIVSAMVVVGVPKSCRRRLIEYVFTAVNLS